MSGEDRAPSGGAAAPEQRVAGLIQQFRQHDEAIQELATRYPHPVVLPSDLTLRQLQVLAIVRGRPGVTGQELSQTLRVSTPTVSGLVDRLVGKGLLTRAPDPADRRRILLSVSQEAHRMLTEMESLRAQVRDEVLTRLTATELESLVAVTARLRGIAEELITPEP